MSKPLTLGAKFKAARDARGLPLEKAAHDTRIHIQRLRQIENDDHSHFTHPSYARMFLIDYAKYLSVPVGEIREMLPAPGAAGSEGYQYLQESEERVVYRPIRPARQRRLIPALVGAVVVVALLFGGFQLMITMRKLDRIDLGKLTKNEASLVQEKAAPTLEAPTAPAPEKIAAFTPPNIGVPVSIDQSIISSDASALNDASVSETPEAVPAPSPADLASPVQALPNGQAPGSPLFVGGTVEHGSTVQ